MKNEKVEAGRAFHYRGDVANNPGNGTIERVEGENVVVRFHGAAQTENVHVNSFGPKEDRSFRYYLVSHEQVDARNAAEKLSGAMYEVRKLIVETMEQSEAGQERNIAELKDSAEWLNGYIEGMKTKK